MRSSVLDPKRSSPPGAHHPGYEQIPYSQQAAMQGSRSYPAQRSSPRPQRPVSKRLHAFSPVEGWSSLFFLAIALYSIVGSMIIAGWVPHSTLLLWSPIVGLLVGFLIAKIPWFSQIVLHLAACLTGHWLAVWLTSSAFKISWLKLLESLRAAFTGSISVGTTSDIVFFFYLAFLTYFLGYFGSWLVYRARLPWLVGLVYSSILLVNLNYLKPELIGNGIALAIAMAGGLVLLIARVHLASQIIQWQREGLYTDRTWTRSITRRCMQIASVFTLLVLVVSWLLPIQIQPTNGKSFWQQLDNAWTNIVSGKTDPTKIFQENPAASNFFGDELTITGSVKLPAGEVLYYTSPSGGNYQAGFTYEQFDGRTWKTAIQTPENFEAESQLPTDGIGLDNKQITTTVTVVMPPAGTKSYVFGPPQPASFNIDTVIYRDGFTGSWTQQKPLKQGERYIVTSLLPTNDKDALSTVPLPGDAAEVWQADPNYDLLSKFYLQTPKNLSANAINKTREWTSGATDAYSALKMLESRLNNPKEFRYSIENPPVPANVNVVDWLLQTRVGYCTYYASAMAMMARQLDIPTRIVNGFSQGRFDNERRVWVVNGTDAHSWVQAFLPGFGWINFDPTPGFSPGANPAAQPTPTATATPAKSPLEATPTVPTKKPQETQKQLSLPGTANGQDNQMVLMGASIAALVISFVIFLAALLSYWWRNLYANSTFVASMFWRLCYLASWAGLAPKKWQTPYEYSRMLSRHMPQKAPELWHLTELFVRERWGAPYQAPREQEEEKIERFWPSLRAMLLRLLFRKRR